MEKNYLLPEITLKYKTGSLEKKQIKNSNDSYDLFKEMYDADTLEYNESVICLFLNRRNLTIAWSKISVGGMSGSIVDPKTIFSRALTLGASGIILSHNHPSGNLKPSQSDIKLTKKINDGCKILELVCLDHIIIANGGYYSFADKNLI